MIRKVAEVFPNADASRREYVANMNDIAAEEPHALRIFVVENHRDTLLYLTMYLESLGHAVASAQTVKGALAALGEGDYDVLISDIGLPDGDGWELLRQVPIRLVRPLFAVAMSGFGLNADHARSKDAGYRHHLLKPFAPAELNVILHEAAHELVTAP